MEKIKTTYRRQGDGTFPYDYYTKERTSEDGDITLKGWGIYGSSSVLSGQSMKSHIGYFKSEEQLNQALVDSGIDPNEVNWSNKWMEPQVSLNHLPDEPDW